MKVIYFDAAFDPLINLVVIVCYIGVVLLGAQLLISEELTLGNLITFIEYIHYTDLAYDCPWISIQCIRTW